jgi:glycosyltransferase involved in cell wall biosynthesis
LAIHALPALREEIPNIKLVLGGKIIRPYDPFEAARQVNCDDLIEFVGWIDENELPSYIRASKVCFFTPDANRTEINNTIATKIYQYAIMGCPQIVSEAKMMREFVVNNGFGYSVATSKDFAEKVISICKKGSSSLSFNMEAIEYWEKTVPPMLDYYTSLTDNTRGVTN